jgi:hypothetical protein
LPDLRGVVLAGNNNMGGVASANLTTTYFGSTNPNSIGAIGGNQSSTLTAANMPGHNHAVFLNDPGHNHTTDAKTLPGGAAIQSGTGLTGGSAVVNSNTTGITIRDTSSGFGTANQTNYTGGGIAVSATLGNTGSGYTNGSQTITVIGGTCTTQPQFTVNVSGNVFTGTPSLLTAGSCTVAPANPAATSGGGGTGGTLNVSYSAQPTSIVQPTRTTNYIIKITPDANSATASGVTSLGGMTGDIACGSGLTCTGNIISNNLGTGTAGYHLTSNGASASTYQGFTAYNAGVSNTRIWQAKNRDVFSVLDYAAATGCVADGVTDCSAAFNAAITAAHAYTQSSVPGSSNEGGRVYVPGGANCYAIYSTITMLKLTSLYGDGNSSCIYAVNTDGITFNYTNGAGLPKIEGIFLTGGFAGISAHSAIKARGTTNDADQMNGLTFLNIYIDNFDIAYDIGTVRNFSIENSFITNTNKCIRLIGAAFVGRIGNSTCFGIYAAGSTGLSTEYFNYTTGSGNVAPEGINVTKSQFFGFENPVLLTAANIVTIGDSDIKGSIYGIQFNTVQGSLNLYNNHIEMTANTSLAGIYGVGQVSPIQSKTNIIGNAINGDGSTTALVGIQINSAITNQQDNVSITDNYIFNAQSYDIIAYNPGYVYISNNKCSSTGSTNSILVGTRVSGLITVEKNNCYKNIVNTTASDLTNGYIRFSDNYINNGSAQASSWYVNGPVGTSGGIPYYSTAGVAVESSALLAQNRLMLGGGAGAAPSTLGSLGTTTTVLHGNATGAPTFAAVISADLNITTTSCTNQFVSAISAGGVGTCSTVSVSQLGGLGTNVATFLATPSSANLAAALTDETGTGVAVFGTGPTISAATLTGQTTHTISDANTLPYQTGAQEAIKLRNTNSTVGNWVEMSFYDSSNTVAAGLAVQITDQTNHRGLYGFYTRQADGFINRMNIQQGIRVGPSAIDPGPSNLGVDGFLSTKAATTFTGTSGTVSSTDSAAIFNPSGAFTATLPTCNSANGGRWLNVKSIAAQTVASASSNVVPRAGGAAGTAILASGAGNWAMIQCDATNWVIMAGS